MTKKQPKLISTKVDLSRPVHDDFDPISHFEITGEDLGLPADYKKRYDAAYAAAMARRQKATAP